MRAVVFFLALAMVCAIGNLIRGEGFDGLTALGIVFATVALVIALIGHHITQKADRK